MRRITGGLMAVGLMLGAAACGSDSDSSSTTNPDTSVVPTFSTDGTDTTDTTDGTVSTSADSTDSTSSDDTVSTTPGSIDAPDIDTSGLGPLQAQVVTENITYAAEQGIEVDAPCFVDAVKGLSDEDAQAILDAGPSGSPEISEEGQAIGSAAALCITFPDDGTDVTAASATVTVATIGS